MHFFKAVSLSLLCLTASLAYAEGKVVPVADVLMPRQPHWRSEIVSVHPSGQPAIVVFHEQIGDEAEKPVKQIEFYSNGKVKVESDLTLVNEVTTEGNELKWQRVPHGVLISFHENGKVEKIAHYDKGILHGDFKLFYPDGLPKASITFYQGKRSGLMQVFFEDGAKMEEATYRDDKIIGDLIRFYPKNVRAHLIPHEDGVPHGHAMEWYEAGALKASRRYDKGLLHSDGKNPAVVIYNEDHAIQEVQDFNRGIPVGLHLQYHKNGKESYRAPYKNGKIDGKEQFFSQEGKLLGEGLFREGVRIGKHWRNHENGKTAFLANFDDQGNLLGFIENYNADGVKKAQFSVKGDLFHGPFKEWYDNGSPKIDFNYVLGKLEGEQKEYYNPLARKESTVKEYFPTPGEPEPGGEEIEEANNKMAQLKAYATYHEDIKDGLYEEWYENGQKAVKVHMKKGVKEGPAQEWFENGKLKLEENYVDGKLDQLRCEWHENGKLKYEGKFASGEKEGLHREWDAKGDLIGEGTYENDQPDGLLRNWFEKGRLSHSIHFIKGEKNGKSEEFYANGQLKGSAFFVNGQMDGKVETFYEDGSPWQILHYKKGIPVGEHKEFFRTEKGEKTKIARLAKFNNDGKPEGEHKTFYPDGTTQSVVQFKDGRIEGMKAIWDQKGNLMEEFEYKAGKLNGRYFQHLPDGKEVVTYYQNNLRNGLHEIYYPDHEVFGKKKAIEISFVNDKAEGEAVEYDQGGNKIATSFYVNGMKDGEAKVYDAKGQLLVQVSFIKDKKEGPAFEYYADGKVAKEVIYFNDELHGEEKSYHPDGKLASSAFYVNGKLHGVSRHWNENGILVFEGEYKNGLRHGKFNKFYDDGKPQTLQTFAEDELHGTKKSYDEKGDCTLTKWEKGKKV